MLVYPSGVDVSSSALRLLSTRLRQHRRAIGSRWRRLSAGRQALLTLAHLRTHLCTACGRVRRRDHDRLPVCHRGCRTPGRPRAHPDRRDTGRVDEGVRDPRRHPPADRSHCRRQAFLLWETQEARHERAGPHGSLRPTSLGLTGPTRRRPRCPCGSRTRHRRCPRRDRRPVPGGQGVSGCRRHGPYPLLGSAGKSFPPVRKP